MEPTTGHGELERIEIDLLVEAVRRQFGIDLSGYTRALLVRRIQRIVKEQSLANISALQSVVLHAPDRMEELFAELTSDPGELFGDAAFYSALRSEVVPHLRTHPSIRIWCAGCATPADAYSLAIVLHEEGLLSRSQLYLTDASELLLARAQTGAVGSQSELDERRYRDSGGSETLRAHLIERGGATFLRPELMAHLFCTQHHLIQDGPFNEFQLILCRNVLLYFHWKHHARIHGLFFDSLGRKGFLGLGRRESVQRTHYARVYEEVSGAGTLYRRAA